MEPRPPAPRADALTAMLHGDGAVLIGRIMVVCGTYNSNDRSYQFGLVMVSSISSCYTKDWSIPKIGLVGIFPPGLHSSGSILCQDMLGYVSSSELFTLDLFVEIAQSQSFGWPRHLGRPEMIQIVQNRSRHR